MNQKPFNNPNLFFLRPLFQYMWDLRKNAPNSLIFVLFCDVLCCFTVLRHTALFCGSRWCAMLCCSVFTAPLVMDCVLCALHCVLYVACCLWRDVQWLWILRFVTYLCFYGDLFACVGVSVCLRARVRACVNVLLLRFVGSSNREQQRQLPLFAFHHLH